MDILKAKINRIKKYNIASLFSIKDILNRIYSRLGNTIVLKIDTENLWQENEKGFFEHRIYLNNDNIKDYLNFSASEIFKNKHNIDGFKVIAKRYDKAADRYAWYSNINRDYVGVYEPSKEMGIDYYQLYAQLYLNRHNLYTNDTILDARIEYTLNLAFDTNGNLLEDESYIQIEPDPDHNM